MASESEEQLIAAAVALGARSVPSWSKEEERLSLQTPIASGTTQLIQQIAQGNDPLGDCFCRLRSPELRRENGATYTPAPIVRAMVEWARQQPEPPQRIVDPGLGSGRFLIAAGKAFPNAELIGIDIDPLATLIARANLAASGLAGRATVHHGDYRSLKLPDRPGKTLYLGNPPYVRHHRLDPAWKGWLTEESRKLGYPASQLAGLHIYFFLATVLNARPGDFGCFITAAEWMDVNYGSLLRQMFLNGLGGQGLTVIEPTASPFADAATTAVITTFEIGSKPSAISVRRVSTIKSIRDLTAGRMLERTQLESQPRWTLLTRRAKAIPSGYIELGEICRVHRGQVTGANRIWISGPHSHELPESVLFRTITRAKELFKAGPELSDASHLKQVIDLPEDLSVFPVTVRKRIERFLRDAKQAGADQGYVAAHRRAWWSVNLRDPAPILATYMARRPPAFVRNHAGARHINIAHGLYPRQPLTDEMLTRLANYLRTAIAVSEGRTYAGGLTKFEPREMERILVPSPRMLQELES